MATAPQILVVDDDANILRVLLRLLESGGHPNVRICDDARQVEGILERESTALLLVDLNMPHINGEELLSMVAERWPRVPVIVLTGESDSGPAVRCMKLGAIDYLVKPIPRAELLAVVDRGLAESALRYENLRLRDVFLSEQVEVPEAFSDILSVDPAMLRLFAYLDAVARGSQPVLIRGETGTGKELVAKALHVASGRTGEFVAVNVGGLDDTMFSDTLFGHEPGAFTGATKQRLGMVNRADTGTLFLDEVGDLSPASQVKLLRLLQEREFVPLGSDRSIPMRARVVAAMHYSPEALRPDLYFRLRSYEVEIPPLRDRVGDLPLLMNFFLQEAAEDLQRPVPTVSARLFDSLRQYAFPGNVRELRALVFQAVGRSHKARIPDRAFLDQIEIGPPSGPRAGKDEISFPRALPSLAQITRSAVDEALKRSDGNRSAAARLLGISRPTIARYAPAEARPTERPEKPASECSPGGTTPPASLAS